MTTTIAQYDAVRSVTKPIGAPVRTPIPRFDPRSREVRAVLEEARSLAAQRDAERISPESTLHKLRELGIAAARVPVELGGAGLSIPEIFGFVLELAEADANIAHALRNHFLISEGFNRPSRWAVGDEVLNAVRDGHLIGTSGNELASAAPAGTYNAFEAKLVPEGDGYRLTAQKGYSTGNLYVSYLLVAAWLPDDSPATVFIPADRLGVAVPDDWDGIGQRLTGSGSTSYDNVRVEAHEIHVSPQQSEVRAFPGTYAQLWMTAVVVGSIKAAIRETIEFVQQRRRNYYHGLAESPRNEPSVQETIGQATANAYIAQTAVEAAIRALDEAWTFRGDPTTQAELSRKAAIAAANAKVAIDPLALDTTSFLFEAGGASAVRSSTGLDRHWRNIRTLASHNPRTYKRRVLGDHALNGTDLPSAAYF